MIFTLDLDTSKRELYIFIWKIFVLESDNSN